MQRTGITGRSHRVHLVHKNVQIIRIQPLVVCRLNYLTSSLTSEINFSLLYWSPARSLLNAVIISVPASASICTNQIYYKSTSTKLFFCKITNTYSQNSIVTIFFVLFGKKRFGVACKRRLLNVSTLCWKCSVIGVAISGLRRVTTSRCSQQPACR